MKLSANTILITGSTSGIGLELGKALRDKGNRVVLLGRSENKVKAAKEMGFEVIQCDLACQNQLETAVAKIENEYSELNMLFNNAGVQYNYSFLETAIPFKQIQQEIYVNVVAQIQLTQMLLPLLLSNKKAYIVNTTSALGAFPKPDGLVYSASKAAMRNFTTGLRYTLKNSGVKVLEFMPPVTDTAMTAGREEPKMTTESLVKAIIPQLEKEKKLMTISKLRLFLWIAFFFPSLAHRVLKK